MNNQVMARPCRLQTLMGLMMMKYFNAEHKVVERLQSVPGD